MSEVNKIQLGNNDNHTYCFSCGAKYPKRMYPRWPVRVKVYRSFSIGRHGYQVGYSFGLVPVIATVVRLGWIRVIFGYRKKYTRGIGCSLSQEHGVVLHDDIKEKVPDVFNDYIEQIA